MKGPIIPEPAPVAVDLGQAPPLGRGRGGVGAELENCDLPKSMTLEWGLPLLVLDDAPDILGIEPNPRMAPPEVKLRAGCCSSRAWRSF